MRLRDGSIEIFSPGNASERNEVLDGTADRYNDREGGERGLFGGIGSGPRSLAQPGHGREGFRRFWPSFQQPSSKFAEDLLNVLESLSNGQSVQRTPQRIVLTGINVGGNTATLASGLATTCAASGFRVLLVDANLDSPTVHKRFGVSNERGLVNLLESSDYPHRLPQTTSVANLAVIAAGPRISSYSSLLSRERLFHRLQPISSHFDYIIADCGTLTAPLVSRISIGADNVIIAVKEHVSSMQDLSNMVRALRAESVPEPAVLMVE